MSRRPKYTFSANKEEYDVIKENKELIGSKSISKAVVEGHIILNKALKGVNNK